MSVSSARRWLLEIFGRKRDGRFLGVCNPGTAARGLFGDLGLLSAHTCPRPAEHNRAPCGHGMYKDPKHRNDPVVAGHRPASAPPPFAPPLHRTSPPWGFNWGFNCCAAPPGRPRPHSS